MTIGSTKAALASLSDPAGFWERTAVAVSVFVALSSFPFAGSEAAEGKGNFVQSPWAEFVESDFPFFSSVLDARQLGDAWPTNNLTPRALILNLGNDCWAAFDIDLLRMAAIWDGKGVTPASMAQNSYHDAGSKVPEGQEKLPQIAGTPWIANGIYPGWQPGAHEPTLADPREPSADAREVGRGPLPEPLGRFKAIRLTQSGVCLEYEVLGASVSEWVESDVVNGQRQVLRRFRLENVRWQLLLILGKKSTGVKFALTSGKRAATLMVEAEVVAVVVDPSSSPIEFGVAMGIGDTLQIPLTRPSDTLSPSGGEGRVRGPSVKSPPSANKSAAVGEAYSKPGKARWREDVITTGKMSEAWDAYVLDAIPLPLDNPWKRNVRLADIAFFRDGRAAAVTFDGDVWIITGLRGDLNEVRWRRFASGLHEPLSLCIRENEVFVFDRNGIWRLRDTDGNGSPREISRLRASADEPSVISRGEADAHELFANAFTQTAETREFANSMKLAPDGSFIISKGGQQGSTLGRHNGSVLRISPDGKTITVLGWGLRQPFLGVHPKTGMVTASDQQGHYVPSTPLHVIRDRHYYGYLAGIQPKEKYPAPIAEPLTWIPHPVNASGASQVWLSGARMGPLNEALIHFGYNRPEIFLVLLNSPREIISAIPESDARQAISRGERAPRLQAAVVSLTQNLDFAPLNGAVNPVDGQLYLTGFQIWGTTAKQTSGLARLRYTGAASTLPREVVPMDKGILLRFDAPLNAANATNPANYSVERWNYRRTASYGSPHFKPAGGTGQEWMTPSSAYLSRDGKSVFVGIPDLKPVMQMRIGWALATRTGKSFEQNAYFTPHELMLFDPAAEGFEPVTVDLTPRTSQAAATPVTAEEGQKLAQLMACVACHATDVAAATKVGPTWKGLFGSQREFKGGEPAIADEAYLRESMLEPAAKVVLGFEKNDTQMPSYGGVLTESQIQALVLYIKSL